MEKFYRVRRKRDGLFMQAAGGRFTKNGKVWPTVGRAKQALAYDKHYRHLDPCEIVEYEVREVGTIK